MGSIFSTPDVPETPVTPTESTTQVDSEGAAKQKAARKKKTTDYSMGSLSTPAFSAKSTTTGRSTLGGA
ncbi:MAG: hypothetical protein R3Y56_07540 [Akkermansia sp.]